MTRERVPMQLPRIFRGPSLKSVSRRDALFGLAALGGALPISGWSQAARAQRVGWLSSIPKPQFEQFFSEFQKGMAGLGLAPGRDYLLEERWSDSIQSVERDAAELVAQKPAVIVTAGPAARYAAKIAKHVPVVFGFSGNPIDAGLSTDFARPDRNMTGITFMQLDLVGKRLEVLKELLPTLKRVAVLANHLHAGEPREFATTKEAADRLQLAISYHPFKGIEGLSEALAGALAARAEAAVVFPDGSTMSRSAEFAQFSLQHRIPMMSGWAAFVEGGNLLSYGPRLEDSWRRVAYFVDRIMKGARPADLPIEFPRSFEHVVNLGVAKALGLTIPQTVLARADRAIS